MIKKLVLSFTLLLLLLISATESMSQNFSFSVTNNHPSRTVTLQIHYGDCNGYSFTAPAFNLRPVSSQTFVGAGPNAHVPVAIELLCGGQGTVYVSGGIIPLQWCNAPNHTISSGPIPTYTCGGTFNGWASYVFSLPQNAGQITFNP